MKVFGILEISSLFALKIIRIENSFQVKDLEKTINSLRIGQQQFEGYKILLEIQCIKQNLEKSIRTSFLWFLKHISNREINFLWCELVSFYTVLQYFTEFYSKIDGWKK